jgi:dCMP deaminase
MRSLCVRSQVGAVIVDPRNRIVATGYNGPAAGFHVPIPMTEDGPYDPLPCEAWCERGINGPTELTTLSYTDCPSLHAEANALSVCDRSVREGGTIYITSHSCFNCAKLIANSGLARVVVRPDHDATYRHISESYDLLRRCKISVEVQD